jgi:bacterioferritin-associated ferredoxin
LHNETKTGWERRASMIICSCNVLSDHDVRTVTAERTPTTTGQVYRCLGCSAQCGRCANTIRRIVDEAIAGAKCACDGPDLDSV